MLLTQAPSPVRQSGLAMVELALALPLLLLLFLSVAEMGRALYQYAILVNAVQAGARDYSLHLDEGLAINLAVYGNPGGSGQPLLPGLDIGAVTVAFPDANYVDVEASYAFQFLPGNPLNAVSRWFGHSGSPSPTLQMHAASVMRL